MKLAQERLYGGGEYYALSAVLAPAADALVAAAEVGFGDTVLDVGAGDGNVAVAAARRGARVVACDLAPAQVERGKARCRREGSQVEWLVADAEQLPFQAESFTHVLSAFGVVFAPRPEVATSEMFRVCRPGGVVAFTSWPHGSFMDEATRAVRALSPEDDPFPDIELGWGDEETIRTRLRTHAATVLCTRRSLFFDPEERGRAGAADCGATWLTDHLDPDALAELQARREHLLAKHRGDDGRTRANFLIVVAAAHYQERDSSHAITR